MNKYRNNFIMKKFWKYFFETLMKFVEKRGELLWNYGKICNYCIDIDIDNGKK